MRELTDNTGTARARYDYDPWGRRTKLNGDKDADFGFTGHYEHIPSGLTLAPFRAYDSNLGRWVSEDPSGFDRGINLYQYVENTPQTSTDRLGLMSWEQARKLGWTWARWWNDPSTSNEDKIGLVSEKCGDRLSG